jgi:hypothetical protein
MHSHNNGHVDHADLELSIDLDMKTVGWRRRWRIRLMLKHFHVVLTFFFFAQLVTVLGMTCADGVNNLLRNRGANRFVCGVGPLLTHIVVNLDRVCDLKGSVKCPNCEVNRHLGERAECPMAFIWPINRASCNSVLTLNVGCLSMVRRWPPLTDCVQR